MKTYDLYSFAAGQKLILGWHSFEAEGDEPALQVAEDLAQQSAMELWQDARLIKRWEAQR